MISFYIISKRFFLKCEGLSDAKVSSITKVNIWLQIISPEANTFLENKMIHIVFNYLFGLTFPKSI